MLKLENVNKYFNKNKPNEIHVLNNVSLDFDKTGLVAILGPSGSGKTTLLNLIGGLDKVDDGEIYINGEKITKTSSNSVDKIRNLNIGYIFQDYKLIDNISVYENIAISLKMIGEKDERKIKKNVQYVLEAVNMYRYRYRLAKTLSGGQKQRVAIARAIIKNPNIIIADEPTGNLDSKNSIAVMDILKSISKEKLVILVTHETELAKQYASRIIEIEDGKIIKDYENNNIENFSKNNANFDITRLQKNTAKYCSIYKIFPSIINGFKKIKTYSTLKKLLMIGYFATALFVVYSISNIFGILNIQESDYAIHDKNYLQIDVGQLSVDDFLKYEKDDEIEYILPGDSLANFQLLFDDYQQTAESTLKLSASLLDVENLVSKDIVYGRLPENQYEVVIDKLVFDRIDTIVEGNEILSDDGISIELGIKNAKDVLDRKLSIDNTPNFTIVGITDKNSQSIYTYKENFINILDNTKEFGMTMSNMLSSNSQDKSPEKLLDYELLSDDITLVEGQLPINDYETIVNISKKNDDINIKVNNTNLKVVGYYESKTNRINYLVNNNTIKYNLICSNNTFSVYTNNKNEAINKLENDYDLNVIDIYEYEKENYIAKQEDTAKTTLMFSIMILAISLIEIFLMMRASFLSRMKEVGILRAIGVKKLDICKKFFGEIIAITTIAGLPGIIIMTYILNELVKVPEISKLFIINPLVFGISILIIYGVNIIFGLLPLIDILKNTPASIFSRQDIQ